VATETVLVHPNQAKARSKATKTAIVLLLVVSSVLAVVVTAGGWNRLAGAKVALVFFIAVYLVMAYYVARWSRGTLALAAALGLLFLVFTVVAAPGWFARSKEGFDDPLLPAQILGLLVVILVPLQLLLVVFSLRGFNQKWNIEVAVPREEAEGGIDPDNFDSQGNRLDRRSDEQLDADEDEEYVDEEAHGRDTGQDAGDTDAALATGEPQDEASGTDADSPEEATAADNDTPADRGDPQAGGR
jgi:hypothetical protein